MAAINASEPRRTLVRTVRASRRFELIVRRGSPLPAWLDARRIDTVEVADIETRELVYFADVPALETKALVRELRRDLAALQDDDFIARWHPG